jgi:hypothetical protein
VDVGLAEVVCPFAEPIGLLGAGVKQDRAGAVDEQCAEVSVTAPGDAAEVSLEAAGVLARGEAEPTGEVPCRWEAVDGSDEGDESSGGEETDAGDAQKQLDRWELFGHRLQLTFHLFDPGFDGPDLETGFSEDGSQGLGQLGVGVLDQGPSVAGRPDCGVRVNVCRRFR